MAKLFNRKNFWSEVRNVLLIFLALAVLMISSAVIELRQSKKELLQLMDTQSHSLLESLLISSQNILRNNHFLIESFRRQMLNNASLVKILYEQHKATPKVLKALAQANDIQSIQIFKASGKKVIDFRLNGKIALPEASYKQFFAPIFTGETDTLILGLRLKKPRKMYLYIVALSSKEHAAIILTVDGQEIITSNARAGFGPLLRSVAQQNPFIVYAALQDTNTLLAASGNVRELEALNASPFLKRAYHDSLYLTRITQFDSIDVFEAVHPFSFNGHKLGLFRLGLSMKPVEDINARIYRRLIFITLLLVILGSFMLTYLFTKQRFYSLKQDYALVETYSTNIIQNVSDAIIVCDQNKGVRIFNRAAEALFGLTESDIKGKTLENVLPNSQCTRLLQEPFSLRQIECKVANKTRILLVSKTDFTIDNTAGNTIFVIRDLTDQKALEEQLNRKERLTAMGELAAGVAHEIRNPLNAIATVVQQLDKDFEPPENAEEYHALARLVYNEVKRINQTIQDFLQFSRPEPLRPQNFELESLIKNIVMQYQSEARKKNVELTAEWRWKGIVYWDKDKWAQVLGNLVRNAIEAIDGPGQAKITVEEAEDNRIRLRVSDTGKGIPPEMQTKIFNLYYTTKASGTGIGLSIVQRIVDQHNGVIRINSVPGKGSEFVITVPKICC
jgi:PAS domain S-box-containing protein